jgi:hypothetical protein
MTETTTRIGAWAFSANLTKVHMRVAGTILVVVLSLACSLNSYTGDFYAPDVVARHLHAMSVSAGRWETSRRCKAASVRRRLSRDR